MRRAVETGIGRREFLQRAGITAAAVGVSGGLSGFLTACGEDSGATRGGVLSVGSTDWLPGDFFNGNSFGPQLTGYVQMAWPLFVGTGKGVEVKNGLASDYRAAGDRRTHTVMIRQGLKFHDGSKITAEAVAANLRAALFTKDPLRDEGSWAQVTTAFGTPEPAARVQARDARTVTIVLKEPLDDIRGALARIFILNPKALEQKDYGTNSRVLAGAGSGPFKMREFRPGSFVEFDRFDGFFEEVLPDRVRLEAMTDPGALALALRGGDVDVASGLAKSDFDSLLGSDFEADMSDPGVNVFFQFFAPSDPAFKDKRVRKAVELAMNRKAYAESFFGRGVAELSSQPIVSPTMAGYVADLEPAPYDVGAARALMKEAGVSSASLSLIDPTALAPISNIKGLLEAIGGDLAEVGIEVKISVVDFATYLAEQSKHGGAVAAYGSEPTPFGVFDLFYRGPAGKRVPPDLRAAPAINATLDRAHAAPDADQRDALLRQVITMTGDESIAIPIALARYAALTSTRVRDFPMSALGDDSWNSVSIAS